MHNILKCYGSSQKRKRWYPTGWLQRTATTGFLKGAGASPYQHVPYHLVNKGSSLPSWDMPLAPASWFYLACAYLLFSSFVVYHGDVGIHANGMRFVIFSKLPSIIPEDTRAGTFHKVLLNLVSRRHSSILTKSPSSSFVFCPFKSSTFRMYPPGNSLFTPVHVSQSLQHIWNIIVFPPLEVLVLCPWSCLDLILFICLVAHRRESCRPWGRNAWCYQASSQSSTRAGASVIWQWVY